MSNYGLANHVFLQNNVYHICPEKNHDICECGRVPMNQFLWHGRDNPPIPLVCIHGGDISDK